MATLIATADGNLTGSTTFAAAETGATSINLIRFNSGGTLVAAGAPALTTVTFTVTNAKVIDGVLLWMKQTTASTGTVKVDLQKGGVSQASVTVNKSDLPDSANVIAIPVFFKFTGTATGDGGANWTLVFTTTGTGTITYSLTASSATTSPTRALRTTTTATPAAADDLYIVGELTGAGTKNTRTVTMDSTTATVYGNGAVNSTSVNGGGIHISNWGTLTYGTTAGTNYLLRVAGDVIVYQYGTLNMGSSAGGSGYTTFDPGTTFETTVSNGGRTATRTTYAGSTEGGARSIDYKATGKYYFEMTIGSPKNGAHAIGILQSTGNYSNMLSAGTSVSQVSNSGVIYSNNGTPGKTVGSLVAGSNVGVAVDLTARLGWFCTNGGNWNGDAAANPATGVGGVIIGTGNFAPAVGLGGGSLNDSVTANFGSVAYSYTPPSGFGDWAATVPASTAVLEFQPVSADGDFGLRCLDNSTVTITGQPRTAGKNVVQCKLTADVVSSNAGTVNFTGSNGSFSTANTILEASGNSLLASGFIDSTGNASHSIYLQGPTITNTTQTGTVWLARGSGVNNRYVRVMMGNTFPLSSIGNGFYSDIDLQAGTAGTVTAVGNGTATSVSITPEGRGYLVRITGKVSSGATAIYFHVASCSAAGTTVYVGAATQCFIFDRIAYVTAASILDTTFNIDTDTGWLSGDAVCVASTTRTASECEIYPLNANAGASSFTSALYPFSQTVVSTHHGTAPIQAEIGLLTRNVKIRSTSPTLMSYVYCTALATVTASWAEFYYVGVGSNNKRGVNVDGGAVANPKSFTYCSIHDCDNNGFYCDANGVTSLNVTFSNNVMWNSLASNIVAILGPVTNSDWTFDSNLVMRSATNMFALGDVGGTCTNNVAVGASANYGFALSESAAVGNFGGNTAHSCASGAMSIASYAGTISNFTGWRCLSMGLQVNAFSTADLVFANLTLFGNSSTTSGNINVTNGDALNIQGGIIAGDTTFACQYGFVIPSTNLTQLNLSNVDMSGTTSIFAPHTSTDFFLNSGTGISNIRGTANNCKFGAPSLLSSKTPWASSANIGIQKYNQTSGDHRTEMTYGQLRTDSAVYHTAAPSMKMTPNNAMNKLESAPKDKGMLVAVASGAAVTASVWVRKDATYTGSQPRLIVRANAAIGINSDTVLAACSDVTSGPTAAFWDVGTATAVTLSNGYLTMTSTSAGSDQGARVSATLGAKTSGKYYFETTLTTLLGSSNAATGIGTTTSTYSGMGSNATVGVVNHVWGGTVYANGSSAGVSMGTRVSGDVVGVAVDLDNRQIWFKKVSGTPGNWNASGTANPATNVGGVAVPSGSMIPFNTSSVTVGNVFTTNFGATAFVGTVPSGFTSGWTLSTGLTGTATWVQLSGTTPSATDDGAVELIVDCDGASGFINVDDWAAS